MKTHTNPAYATGRFENVIAKIYFIEKNDVRKTWIRVDQDALDALLDEFKKQNSWADYGAVQDFVRLLKERNVNRDRT